MYYHFYDLHVVIITLQHIQSSRFSFLYGCPTTLMLVGSPFDLICVQLCYCSALHVTFFECSLQFISLLQQYYYYCCYYYFKCQQYYFCQQLQTVLITILSRISHSALSNCLLQLIRKCYHYYYYYCYFHYNCVQYHLYYKQATCIFHFTHVVLVVQQYQYHYQYLVCQH